MLGWLQGSLVLEGLLSASVSLEQDTGTACSGPFRWRDHHHGGRERSSWCGHGVGEPLHLVGGIGRTQDTVRWGTPRGQGGGPLGRQIRVQYQVQLLGAGGGAWVGRSYNTRFFIGYCMHCFFCVAIVMASARFCVQLEAVWAWLETSWNSTTFLAHLRTIVESTVPMKHYEGFLGGQEIHIIVAIGLQFCTIPLTFISNEHIVVFDVVMGYKNDLCWFNWSSVPTFHIPLASMSSFFQRGTGSLGFILSANCQEKRKQED